MANINLKDFPDDLHQAAKIKAAVDKTTSKGNHHPGAGGVCQNAFQDA